MRLVMLTPEDWEALSNSLEEEILFKSAPDAARLGEVLQRELVRVRRV